MYNSQENKDKRISFLSILSSITQLDLSRIESSKPIELSEIAYKLNDELFERYPFSGEQIIEEQTTYKTFPKKKGRDLEEKKETMAHAEQDRKQDGE